MGVYSKFNRPIVVVDYDPQWPARFEQEKERIIAALANRVLTIEHIGSTAVPGLAAKPVIDIAVGIPCLADAELYLPCLIELDYIYEPSLEQTFPERRFLWKGTPLVHTYHLHVAEVDHPILVRPKLFRDYLRHHAEAVAAYATLKRALAVRCGQDLDAYVAGKTALIEQILEQALRERNSLSAG
jgi:GrpB-like predicted nucleotidyltransferase (UPF0157 family)